MSCHVEFDEDKNNYCSSYPSDWFTVKKIFGISIFLQVIEINAGFQGSPWRLRSYCKFKQVMHHARTFWLSKDLFLQIKALPLSKIMRKKNRVKISHQTCQSPTLNVELAFLAKRIIFRVTHSEVRPTCGRIYKQLRC